MLLEEEVENDCFSVEEYFEILHEREEDYFEIICEYMEEWE